MKSRTLSQPRIPTGDDDLLSNALEDEGGFNATAILDAAADKDAPFELDSAERELLERWNVRMVAGCAHHSTNIAPAVVREALRFVLPWLPPAFAAQQRAK